MKTMLARYGNALRPTDQDGEDAIRRLGMGEVVTVEFRRSRNIKHLRKWWVLMGIIASNSDGVWSSKEMVSDALKMAAGHVESFMDIDGNVLMRPSSISFEAMDQTEFERFYDRAMELVVTRILPGINKADLEREVMAALTPFGRH